MKKIRIIICLLTILLIAVAFSVVASATEESTVAYRYTKNGVTVEAEHVDGENDLSHIVGLADAGTTVYVLKDIEMASGSTSESPLISVKKNLTIDLGGNTLTIKQNGKNYIRTYNNVTATWQNGTINAARMDKEGYAHPLFRFPNMASPTLNLINITSYTGGLIANRTGQSVTVNIEGGEHHLVLKNDVSFNSMIFSLSGTNLTAKDTSFYVGSYNLLTAMSSGATDGNPNHNYTFTDCDIIGVPTTSRLVGYANQYVNVAFNGCNIVGGLKTPQLFSWDSDKSIGAIESGAITLGVGTCLANGASIDTTGVVACAANAIENAISISKDFTLNYSSGTVFDGDLAIAESTKTFDFATEYVAIDYSYTKDGETAKAKHVDGTMDLSHIVGLADADTTVYVHSDIEMANGSTSKSALINVTKNLTIDLGGNTLTIKQNGQNYINTASNATATWQNGEIIAAYATEDKAASAYPVFSFFDATNPTLNIINVTSYTGGLIGNRTSKSVEVNIEGGEHHFAFKNDMNFTSIIVATSGTELNAKDTSFYLGASASNSLLSALSNSNPDEPYCNHTYTFTDCNVIGASNAARLVGYANQYVKVSFIGCKLVGGLKIPNLHSFDSDKSITAAESGAITLGEGTYISAGAVIDTTGIVVYDGEASSINVDKGFKLYYASGDLYSGFTTKKSTKYFNFTQKVIDPNNVPKTEETLIDSSTSWKYLDNNTDPAAELDSLTAWTLPGFDDSAWKTGVGSFGTKSGALAAVNGKTPTVQLTQYKEGTTTNIPAYFFRTTVNIEDVSEISYIYLHVFADDGVAVYVNGTLMLDTRASTGSTTNLFYSEYTSSFESTLTINSAELLGALVDGENTIAVELHNGHSSSSDLYFGMEEFTVYYKQEDEVPATQVILGVGSNETERSVSWLSTSTLAGDVRVALASEIVDDTFPEDCESFEGVSTPATNKGGYFALDAVITGLKENTAYAYQIVMQNGTSEIFYFNTGSFGDYSFIFVGDPQIKTESEGESWGDTLDKLVNEFDSEIIISAGDQIVTPSSEEQYGYFVKDKLSSIAFAPSVGPVHDDPSKSFADHFYTPNASASYGITTSASNYWYVYNNTLFMHLNMADTSASTNGEHESFMREAMAANPDVLWNIVVMHSSLFSTGMHGNPDYSSYNTEIGKYRPALAPLFTELGIDAVLSGHDHVYLRTKMMNGEEVSDDTAIDSLAINPDGTLYLCASSSTGSKFYSKTYEPTFAACENYEERKSAIYFTVTDTTLTMTSYFLDDMSVFDTFTIYKGEEDGSITADIGHSCSFQNDISLNSYIPEADLEGYTDVYLLIERNTYVDGVPTTVKMIIDEYTVVDGNLRFVYNEIAACEMGDIIYSTIYATKDGSMYTGETIEYSVMTYAYNKLEESDDNAFKTLLVDMLNYGASAQLYFGYDTENLVNAALTDEQRALASTQISAESISRVVADIDGESAGIIGQSVVFNSNVELKYYMRFTDGTDISALTLLLTYTTVRGVEKTVEIRGENFVYVEAYDAYGVKYTDIAAADMSCEILATVYNGDAAISDTTAYSIESYVANRLEASTNEAFKALITEMYKYSESARTYFELE